MRFKKFRKYLSKIDRISMCQWETLDYQTFWYPHEIPKEYDKMYVVGIGLQTSEFVRDGEMELLPCMEVMVSCGARWKKHPAEWPGKSPKNRKTTQRTV